MKAKLLELKNNWKDTLALGLLSLFGLWVVAALLFQISMVAIHFWGPTEMEQNIANEFSWKFDGTFKNSPGNIWYNADEQIWVDGVTNEVKIGKLAGNRKLEFGVKNILEEYLQEKGYNLGPNRTQGI